VLSKKWTFARALLADASETAKEFAFIATKTIAMRVPGSLHISFVATQATLFETVLDSWKTW
jgi:hypothetical protein